jgi:hypothetical protein
MNNAVFVIEDIGGEVVGVVQDGGTEEVEQRFRNFCEAQHEGYFACDLPNYQDLDWGEVDGMNVYINDEDEKVRYYVTKTILY